MSREGNNNNGTFPTIDYEKLVKEKYPDAHCRIAQRTANKAIFTKDSCISDSVDTEQEAWKNAYITITRCR